MTENVGNGLTAEEYRAIWGEDPVETFDRNAAAAGERPRSPGQALDSFLDLIGTIADLSRRTAAAAERGQALGYRHLQDYLEALELAATTGGLALVDERPQGGTCRFEPEDDPAIDRDGVQPPERHDLFRTDLERPNMVTSEQPYVDPDTGRTSLRPRPQDSI